MHPNSTDTAAAATAEAPPGYSIVCLSPTEWANGLPTNRQQIMRRAAERGHHVLFVETGNFLGTHLLHLLRRPNRRSLALRLVAGETVAPGVTVRKAFNVLPWGQRYTISDRVNGWISARVVSHASRRLPDPRVTWLYDPRATWAIGRSGDEFAVYDCVDDYPEQTDGARNHRLIAKADRKAALLSRLVFTTTTPLYERHRAANARTHLVGNVADFDHFAPAVDRSVARPDLQHLARPVLGFAGNFLGGKVDLDLIDDLAASLETGSLVLAGPAADPDVAARLRKIASQANVVWLGPVDYVALPSIVAAFDVGLIPYLENAYTRSCFPLKLFEYLAAGKPVVASGLPELEGMEPDVILVSGSSDFSAATNIAAGLNSPEDVARRQALAAANTWESRTSRLLELTAAELGA